MNNSTPIIGSSLRALLGAQLGCGLAVSDAVEEPEALRLLPFQLWAGGRMALPTSLVCCEVVVASPR